MGHERPIPSVRCSAKAHSTGEPCKRYAVPGSTVCHFHGAKASQVQAKAATTETMATLMARDRRHPWEVVLDATHLADTLMVETKTRIEAGDQITADTLDRLVKVISLAHHMAKTAISTKAYEVVVRERMRRASVTADLPPERAPVVIAAVIGAIFDALSGTQLDGGERTAFVGAVTDWRTRALPAAVEAARTWKPDARDESFITDGVPASDLLYWAIEAALPPLGDALAAVFDRLVTERVRDHPDVASARAAWAASRSLEPARPARDSDTVTADVLNAAEAAVRDPARAEP